METALLVLVSYDVPAAHRSAASRVAHLIFGRNDAAEEGPVPYVQRAGVVWIGQSVFLMPQAVAQELTERLRGLGATVATAHVTVLPAEIEALRRRRRSTRSRKQVDGVPFARSSGGVVSPEIQSSPFCGTDSYGPAVEGRWSTPSA